LGVHHGHVLRILRDGGAQTRATLARASELSATTLTHVTAQLLRDRIVVELDPSSPHSVGRPGQALQIIEDARHVVGAHVGAGAVSLVIADLSARPVASNSFDFDVASTSPQQIVSQLAAMTRELVEASNVKGLIGVGMGVPGQVDAERRKVLHSINVGWRNVPFADMIEDALGMPAIVEHNVSAMARAECRYGIGKGVPCVLYVYQRTGLGAGLVVDGVPFRPGGHGAVELGHIQVAPGGARCACGNTGCVEAFLGEGALMKEAGITGPVPQRLLSIIEGHKPTWDLMLRHLASALASAVNLLTPDLIIFGGHLGEAPDSLFNWLRSELPPRVMPHMREILRLERASFGNRAGAVGGASVALDEFFYSGALQ
jgi:predicted NBD/HSP70 family sugar kinase